MTKEYFSCLKSIPIFERQYGTTTYLILHERFLLLPEPVSIINTRTDNVSLIPDMPGNQYTAYNNNV